MGIMISDYGNEIQGLKVEVRMYEDNGPAAETQYNIYVEIKAKAGTLPKGMKNKYKIYNLEELPQLLKYLHDRMSWESRYKPILEEEERLMKDIQFCDENITGEQKRKSRLTTELLQLRSRIMELRTANDARLDWHTDW